MSGYDIFLSSGSLLTTVNVKTVDTRGNSSVYLIGQGIPNYGSMIAQDFVWMMENFSNNTPPVHSLTGQLWHDNIRDQINFYNGVDWVPVSDSRSSAAASFRMLTTATNMDFTITGIVPIFTGSVSRNYFPTSLILVPNGAVTASSIPTFNIRQTSAGDILPDYTPALADAAHYVHVSLTDSPLIISGAVTVSLEVTVAATGGQLNYDAYLFGFTL
jgi:hypothetical protein